MADLLLFTKKLDVKSSHCLCLVVVFACLFSSVSGYYCEYNLCGSEQYCCGENLCCDNHNVYSFWYFWAAVLCIFMLVTACGGLLRYCYFGGAPRAIVVTRYVAVGENGHPDQSAPLIVGGLQRSASLGFPVKDDLPPSYAQVAQSKSFEKK